MNEDIKISQRIRFEKACAEGEVQEVQQWLKNRDWTSDELNYGLFLACEKDRKEVVMELALKMSWKEVHAIEDRCFFKAVASNAQDTVLFLASDIFGLEQSWVRFNEKHKDQGSWIDWVKEVTSAWSPFAGGKSAWTVSVKKYLKNDFPIEPLMELNEKILSARKTAWIEFAIKHEKEWHRRWGAESVIKGCKQIQMETIEQGFWSAPWHLNSKNMSEMVLFVFKDLGLDRGSSFFNQVFKSLEKKNQETPRKKEIQDQEADFMMRWQENLIGMQLIAPQRKWQDWMAKQPWIMQWSWDDERWDMFGRNDESRRWLDELKDRQKALREKEQLEECLRGGAGDGSAVKAIPSREQEGEGEKGSKKKTKKTALHFEGDERIQNEFKESLFVHDQENVRKVKKL